MARGQIGLAGTGRADAEDHLVAAQGLDVGLLAGRARRQAALARARSPEVVTARTAAMRLVAAFLFRCLNRHATHRIDLSVADVDALAQAFVERGHRPHWPPLRPQRPGRRSPGGCRATPGRPPAAVRSAADSDHARRRAAAEGCCRRTGGRSEPLSVRRRTAGLSATQAEILAAVAGVLRPTGRQHSSDCGQPPGQLLGWAASIDVADPIARQGGSGHRRRGHVDRLHVGAAPDQLAGLAARFSNSTGRSAADTARIEGWAVRREAAAARQAFGLHRFGPTARPRPPPAFPAAGCT